MNDDSVRKSLTAAMLNAGVVIGDDRGHMYVYKDGREYMILLTVVDLTNFANRENDNE